MRKFFKNYKHLILFLFLFKTTSVLLASEKILPTQINTKESSPGQVGVGGGG
tara:strand:- start:26 stop:181 length:156 start_codon:yes stop_codon:yes gene_type:complete